MWSKREYYTALKELNKRYGNPILIVESYIDRVRAWPRLQDSSGVSGFCTQVFQLAHVFKSMDFHEDLKSRGLLADLTFKLPGNIRESWGRYVATKEKGNPTVQLFHDERRGFKNGWDWACALQPDAQVSA